MNANVAPFDAALPGALPAVNAKSVELAARLGFALGGAREKCPLPTHSFPCHSLTIRLKRRFTAVYS